MIHLRNDSYGLRFPFRWLSDKERRVHIVALVAPFRRAADQNTFLRLKSDGIFVMGFTQYQEFPYPVSNPHENKYYRSHVFDYSSVDAWGTCFRTPLPYPKPQIDIVESDFVDASVRGQRPQRRFDYVYVCLPDSLGSCRLGWQSHCRNWQFAKDAINAFADAGFRGVLVGRQTCRHQLSFRARKMTVTTRSLTRDVFLKRLAESRVLFVPNKYDASPRVIPESILLGTAVLVNKYILGGWKYVRPSSGSFFDPSGSLSDLTRTMANLINKSQSESIDGSFYSREYGRERTSTRLGEFLLKHKILNNAFRVHF